MLIKETENNYCIVLGTIESELVLSHEIYEEKFYTFKLKTRRLSDSFDIINVTVSERLLREDLNLSYGAKLEITGQFRSYNNFSETGNKLILTLFAKDISEVYYVFSSIHQQFFHIQSQFPFYFSYILTQIQPTF